MKIVRDSAEMYLHGHYFVRWILCYMVIEMLEVNKVEQGKKGIMMESNEIRW